MTLTLELPADLEAEAAKIPDLQSRVATFLRHQIDLEKWRAGRYSEQARQLVAQSAIEAERMRSEGFDREQVFEEFFKLHQEITTSL